MYHLEEVLKKIYEEAPRTVNLSLDEFIAEVEKRTDLKPSKSTVRRLLGQIGIVAETGKKRVFVFRHNAGKGE